MLAQGCGTHYWRALAQLNDSLNYLHRKFNNLICWYSPIRIKFNYNTMVSITYDSKNTRTYNIPPYSDEYLAQVARVVGVVFLARYVYDAWGNHKVLNSDGTENTSSTFIGNINPLRYRGYYYDSDLGLYYLMTRYYDPEIGRFISADSIEYLDPETIGGLNLFAYCNNNPVMGVDPTGTFIIAAGLLIGLTALGFAVGFGCSIVSQGLQYGWHHLNAFSFLQAGIDGLFAACSTLLAYSGLGALGMSILGGLSGFAQYSIDSIFNHDFSWSGALISIIVGFSNGMLGGAGARNAQLIEDTIDRTGQTAMQAISTAVDRYGLGNGTMLTLRLYQKRLAASLSKAVTKNFIKGATNSYFTSFLSYLSYQGLNQINWGF